MKRYLPIFILLFSHWAYSQGLNYDRSFDAAFNNSKKQLVVIDSNNYLLWSSITPTGQPYGFPSPQHRITKVNTEGDTLWERDVLPNWSLEMIPSENGGVYISGSEIYGHMNSLAGWHIYRIEPDGTINWMKSLDWYSNEPDSLITGLSLNENGKLMYNSSEDTLSVIFTIDTDTTLLDSLRVYENNLQGIQNLNGYKKVAYRGEKLFGFDANGLVEDNKQFESDIQNILSLNDTLFVLTSDTLFSFDQNLVGIDTFASSFYNNFSNLKPEGQSLRFISSGNGVEFLISVDHQLQPDSLQFVPVNLNSNASKDFDNNHFSVAQDFYHTSSKSVRIRDYHLNSPIDATQEATDIGVVDFDITLVQTNFQGYLSPQGSSGPLLYNVQLYADVLIKNYGNKTLNSFNISHYYPDGQSFSVEATFKHFENFSIAPGEVQWLTLGKFHSLYHVFSETNSPFTIEVCIYTSSPNHSTDLNVSNDSYCKDVIVGYAGIEEQIQPETFEVYPNPVQDQLNIFYAGGQEGILKLTSLEGKVLRQTQVSPEAVTYMIPLDDLAAGVYLVVLENLAGEVLLTKKVVKE